MITAMRRRALLLLALLLALAAPRSAWAREITLRSFHSDVTVNSDGTVDVVETLRFFFTGSWNGINRDISLHHNTAEGARAKLGVRVLSVTDGAGRDLRYEQQSPEGYTKRLHIFVPDANDAERTVIIRYRVMNGIRFFQQGSTTGPLDELYWNVTGNGWDMPIEQASVRFVLPGGAIPTRTSAYTGYAGQQGTDVTVDVRGSGVSAQTTRALAPGEGLTVAVGWPPGMVPRPSAAQARMERTVRWWPLGLPILAFVLMFRRWSRTGRDPKGQAITVQYEPPDGMTPAEMGTLVDNSADPKDVTSTLVDLSVRGYIGVEEREHERMLGLLTSREYVFHMRKPSEEWEGLAEHERLFIDAFFRRGTTGAPWEVVVEATRRAREAERTGQKFNATEFIEAAAANPALAGGGVAEDDSGIGTLVRSSPRDEVRLKDLQNSFYTSLPGIRDAVFESLVRRGYYLKRPDKATAGWTAGGIVIGILSGVGGGMLSDAGFIGDPLPLVIGGIASGAVMFCFGLAMGARTEKGARAREAALGFREFLDRVETDRYRRMITGPEMFEKYLPYAMVFGLQERWARAFEGMFTEPPDWYSGSGSYGTFHPTHFSNSLGSMASNAGSSFTSSPSGSGGGGSSGGGSGGGGGSGF